MAWLAVGPVQAALITKAATGTSLDSAGSWSGSIPGSADTAVWNASSLGAGLTLNSGYYWNGITVTGAVSDIGISGYGALGLGAGGIDMSVSAVNFSLADSVLLTTNQIWNVNAGKSLNVSGVVSGSYNITKNGGGALTLSANNTMVGVTTVNAGTLVINGQVHYNEGWHHLPALTVNSGGTVVVANGDADNFLGQCNFEGSNNIINGGVLQFQTANGVGEAIERAFSIGNLGATFQVVNPGATLQFSYFSDAMQFSVPPGANITLSGAGTGLMAKSITGYGGLIKDGPGSWALNATNTYMGPTIVSNGTIIINASLWNSAVTVNNGATFAGLGVIPQGITLLPGAQARLTNGAIGLWTGPLILNSNLVHVALGYQMPPGTYPLATYQNGGSTGAFNPIPVIDSGTLSNNCSAIIKTGRGSVNLVVLPPPAPKLAVISVNNGINPTAGLPFNIVLQAQDTNGNALTVAANTPVALTLTSGYGTLGGNLAATIPAGSSSVTIIGVTYSLDEPGIIVTASNPGGVWLPGDSAPFTVNLGPAALITVLSGTNCSGLPGLPLPNPIVVRVTDAGGNPAAGVGVLFTLTTVPTGTVGQTLTITNITTDIYGTASTALTPGNKRGAYVVTASLPGSGLNPATITATAANTKWVQAWSDEFNYNGLPDSNKWSYELGFVRNGESEYYTSNRPQNVCVTNGSLVITARKEQYIPAGQFYPAAGYTSASLITLGKENFTYGRMEMRAWEPQPVGGAWTAFWMQGTNFPVIGWPICGEIDISEWVNWNTNPHGNAFWGYNGGSVGEGKIDYSSITYDNFHIYAAEWYADHIDYFYDNTNYYTMYLNDANVGTSNAFRMPQYILANFALGGAWGGTIYDAGLPQQFTLDYIRVYQLPPNWIGSNSNALWSYRPNWTNSVLPAYGGPVVFAATNSVNCFIDTTFTQAGLSFYDNAGSDVIAATNGGMLVLNGNGIFNYSTNPQTINAPIALAANEMFNADPGGLNVNGAISGPGFGLTKTGSGTLSASGADTYSGPTTILGGTLALASGGSLQTSGINLAAGATFDISALGAYTFGGSVALAASGTGLVPGASAACLKGGSGSVIYLNANPINLQYDGADPALYVSQGTLSLAANPFVINSANGQALPVGTYPIIKQAVGNIVSSGPYPAAAGTAVGAGQAGLIVVTNNLVNLVIVPGSTMSLTVSISYGAKTLPLTFSGAATNLSYRIQANSNLATTNWITLYASTGSNPPPVIVDPGASTNASRFYRAVSP